MAPKPEEPNRKDLGSLGGSHRRFFRDELRMARSATLKDAENFSEVLFALERLGSFMHGSIGDLGRYKDHFEAIAKNSPLFDLYGTAWGVGFHSLFRLVKEARNDSMHIGAFARHAANNSVMVSLILEDALMSDASTLNDFMVTEPVCAELWQPIGLIRQKMLANSFSFLPLRNNESETGWSLVSDSQLAMYLRGVSNNERGRRLAKSLRDAVDEDQVDVADARCLRLDEDIGVLREDIGQAPILLFKSDDRSNLQGIVTAFDLL